MLLVTCDTAICLPAIVAKFGEEYRNRIQAFKSNAVCSWPSDANGPTICVKVPRIWIFSCLECSDGGGRLTKWGINFQLNFPLKVFEGAATSWTEREREKEREQTWETWSREVDSAGDCLLRNWNFARRAPTFLKIHCVIRSLLTAFCQLKEEAMYERKLTQTQHALSIARGNGKHGRDCKLSSSAAAAILITTESGNSSLKERGGTSIGEVVRGGGPSLPPFFSLFSPFRVSPENLS